MDDLDLLELVKINGPTETNIDQLPTDSTCFEEGMTFRQCLESDVKCLDKASQGLGISCPSIKLASTFDELKQPEGESRQLETSEEREKIGKETWTKLRLERKLAFPFVPIVLFLVEVVAGAVAGVLVEIAVDAIIEKISNPNLERVGKACSGHRFDFYNDNADPDSFCLQDTPCVNSFQNPDGNEDGNEEDFKSKRPGLFIFLVILMVNVFCWLLACLVGCLLDGN